MKPQLSISINGQACSVPPGISVAAALALHGLEVTRVAIHGSSRAPLCGMGICQECRVSIDARPHQLACQTLCIEGIQIVTGDHV